MKLLSAVGCFLLLGICTGNEGNAGTQSCSQLSAILGEMRDMMDWDSYTVELMSGCSREFQIRLWTTIQWVNEISGIDVLISDQREKFLCDLLSTTTMREVHELLANPPHFESICIKYQEHMSTIKHYTTSMNLELPHAAASLLSSWMNTTGFPDFPKDKSNNTSHQDMVNGLNDIKTLAEGASWTMRKNVDEILTDLLPMGLLHSNGLSAEEIVSTIERSNNLFTYTGDLIGKRTGSVPITVKNLKWSYDVLKLVQYHYDKLLWLPEFLTIISESSFAAIGNSECEIKLY